MVSQVVLGSALLLICALLHVAVVAGFIPLLTRLGRRAGHWRAGRRVAFMLSAGILAILLAHSAAIWLWALSFWLSDQFADFPASFYFATVTYTTLGYGDIVLDSATRIFATFAAITGLLTFGISTAFLIGLLARIMPEVFDAS